MRSNKNKRSRGQNPGAGTAENDGALFSDLSIPQNARTHKSELTGAITPGWLLHDQARRLETHHLRQVAYHADHARRAAAIRQWVERMGFAGDDDDEGWAIEEARGTPAREGTNE